MLTWKGFLGIEEDFLSSAFAILLMVTAMLSVWLLYLHIADISRYPSGPLRLPAIGNIPQLIWHGGILEFLMQSWRKYGDIFTIQMGSKIFVVLNGYETIENALVTKADSFSEHNRFFVVPGTDPTEFEGILFSPYPAWKDHRKLIHKVFKDLGFVKQDLEEKVNQEIVKVIEEISSKGRNPFSMDELLPKATSNVISNVVFGSRFEYNDKEFVLLLDNLRNIVVEGRTAAICQMFPMLQYLPLESVKMSSAVQANARLQEVMNKKVTEIERNFTSAPPSYIKAYIEEMRKDKVLKTGSLTRSRCVASVGDLFGAGSETTATALEWAFLHCIMHPDMQQRIQTEIDYVLGQRAAVLSDRPNMPYVCAFLTEVLRFGSVAALGLPHRVIHDVFLNGTFIPKETEIIINLHSILHDARIFDEPSAFQPVRFLDHDEKFVQQPKLTPFGLGRRACVGEDLAQTELFLFFVAVMQRFTLLPAPGENLSANALFGITRRPTPYKLISVPR